MDARRRASVKERRAAFMATWKLASEVSRATSSPKLVKRVFRCRDCGKAATSPGTRGPRQTRCVRCRKLALARALVRSAARLARKNGDPRLADALARIVEL